MPTPILVLAAIFVLIAMRRIGGLRLQIWWVMTAGAAAVILLGAIDLKTAASAINLDVIVFLFGMFLVGRALEDSGYLSHLAYAIFRRAGDPSRLLFVMIFVFAGLSAFLMNDTVAIVGAPIIIHLSRKHGLRMKPYLFALIFSVTLGSAFSPIGNPQNLLIAVGGSIANPFVAFVGYLFIPSAINLLLLYAILKLRFREELAPVRLEYTREDIADPALASLSRLSLIIVAILVTAKIVLVALGSRVDFRLTYIAVAAALPLLFHKERFRLMRRLDWSTLAFFASMFVVMRSVWDSGFFQGIIERNGIEITSMPSIFAVSVLLSQAISNVPLVALYLPMLTAGGAGVKELAALAAGSTVAGNLLILGAASNIIVIQNSESRGGESVGFLEFAKLGIPLTAVNVAVYWSFLQILP